jgi:hypothetical protein
LLDTNHAERGIEQKIDFAGNTSENEYTNISMSKIDSDAKYSDEIANLRGKNSSLSTAIQVVSLRWT